MLTIESILARDPGWLLGAVTTDEAAEILSIPAPTLTTWRSRKSGGPRFVRIPCTRIVRYIRVELFRWLFAGGLLNHNGATGIPVELPDFGKPLGSDGVPSRSLPVLPEQPADMAMEISGSPPIKPHPRRSRRRTSNSPRKPPRGGGRHGEG